MTTALVLGGTGAVGGAVVAALAARDVAVTFTYRRSVEQAAALTAAHGARAVAVDLAIGANRDAGKDGAIFESKLCRF